MGLSRCTEADLMTADEAVANRCGPRGGGRGPSQCLGQLVRILAMALLNKAELNTKIKEETR
jgi:hypothetical protein